LANTRDLVFDLLKARPPAEIHVPEDGDLTSILALIDHSKWHTGYVSELVALFDHDEWDLIGESR